MVGLRVESRAELQSSSPSGIPKSPDVGGDTSLYNKDS